MSMKMPRGAMPTPRNELAASEPYRPEGSLQIYIPSGAFPTPNQDLAAAPPYKPAGVSPGSFLAWPLAIDSSTGQLTNSIWAEEAFAKASVEPRTLIPRDAVDFAAQRCGLSNFAEFMQTHGFQMDGKAFLDGPFLAVDWTNTAVLNNAIANVGPVKIGVHMASLTTGPHGHLTPGHSGWGIHGLAASQPGNHCASLCGFGPLRELIELFRLHGIEVALPPGMPTGLCYAMFVDNSVGIIDRQSLINITGEAWLRNPTTIIKNLRG